MKLFGAIFLLLMAIFSPITFASFEDELSNAEEFWKNRRNKGSIEKAIMTLENVIGKDAGCYDALWRLGRYYQFIGDCIEKKNKLLYYEKGLKYAERAIQVNPQGTDGHLQYSILLGCISMEQGIVKGLSTVKKIRDELLTAIRLDPQNARAHNTLALLYWNVPGNPISIGNKKRALEEAALAVKFDSQTIYYWLVYGRIAKDNREHVLAHTALKKVLDLPVNPEDPADEYYKTLAEQEFKRLSQS